MTTWFIIHERGKRIPLYAVQNQSAVGSTPLVPRIGEKVVVDEMIYIVEDVYYTYSPKDLNKLSINVYTIKA